MSDTLAPNELVPEVAALPKAILMASPSEAVTEKPSFFARMLEAIGKAYYVPTPDGEGIYILPSC